MISGEENKLTDEQLALSYQSGDDDSFEVLYLRYKYMIKACAHSYFLEWGDDEDLLQFGSIGLLKAARNYRAEQKTTFSSFAYTCIHTAIISAIKNANSLKNLPLNTKISINAATDEIYDGGINDPEVLVISKENESELLVEIKGIMSGFEVKVLSMYLKGLSYTEIGEKLSKSPKSIDNALQRIKRKISDLLAKRRA